MNKIWGNKEYPYLYDTHVHTKQASACGEYTGSQMAKAYKKAGYTGIIVTDHFFYGNTAVSRDLPWKEWVEKFYMGYADAKAEGERIGLQVFWGWESGYQGTEFLIYGLNKEWLLQHPEIREASIEEQHQLVHEGGGIVVHAHPFREEFYIDEIRLFPKYIDAVEAVNASHSNPDSLHHRNPDFDKKAICYAKEYDFPITAGSDMHVTDLLGGGMAFHEKITSISDFVSALYEKKKCMLTDGFRLYNNSNIENEIKRGNRL